jgi:hypothetical protein
MLDDNPGGLTAERLADVLFREFSLAVDGVESVTVLRSRLAGIADDTVEATVRAVEPASVPEVVDMFRQFAHTNGLAFYAERPPLARGTPGRPVPLTNHTPRP